MIVQLVRNSICIIVNKFIADGIGIAREYYIAQKKREKRCGVNVEKRV